MASLMVKSPRRPRSSSARLRFISAVSTFMRSASWIATIVYGVKSSTRLYTRAHCERLLVPPTQYLTI